MSFTWNCPKCSAGMVIRNKKLICPVCGKIGLENAPNLDHQGGKKPQGATNGKKPTTDTSELSVTPQEVFILC